MTLGDLKARVGRISITPAAVIVTVLIASIGVAGLLAAQAIAMARSRQAVSDAMLREYAELAAWEFSREARKDVDNALMRAFMANAHPERQANDDQCDCALIPVIDYWFEVSPGGAVVSRGIPIPSDVLAGLGAGLTRTSSPSSEISSQLRRLSDTDDRLVMTRWMQRAGPHGALLGLVMKPAALAPIMKRAFARAVLLPPRLTADRDPRTLVQVRVVNSVGDSIFTPNDTPAGPQRIVSDLFPGMSTGLQIESSMAPAFVASLGPEHGSGLSNGLVIGLVLINTLMVAVGLWQLGRERELARLRGDFVAGVSHELRTPLAQIRMFADTLLLDRVRNPGERRRALEIIGQETRRLTQLVENVLYFHRHRRVPEAPAQSPIDLSALVRDVANGFAPLAASRRARIVIRSTGFPVGALGDEDGLRQVLLNLLDNAVKFGPPDQTVTISLDVVDRRAHIAVQDQGPGVPVADRRRIFRAFERGRDTGGAGGAGIGLAIVQQIVTAHGGDIAVDAAMDGGARFVITLPILDPASHAGEMSLAG